MLKLLEGISVLDLGRLMPSGIATAELAKLGADVVKIESSPAGDYLRSSPPLIGDRGEIHLEVNRNKRSLCLDLATRQGREVVLRMLPRVDVFITSGRPFALRKLGLGYADVQAINPALVYCEMTGYGTYGPYSALGAHGYSSDMAAGLLDAQPGRLPNVSDDYVPVGPRASGLYASLGIVASLLHRHSTGLGTYLETSQWDAAVAWNFRGINQYENTNTALPSMRDLGPRYAFYLTSDERVVLLAAPEPALWRRFCKAVHRDDLAGPADDSVAIEFVGSVSLGKQIAEIISQRTQAEWLELATAQGVPIAPFRTVAELGSDAHFQARSDRRTDPHPLAGTVSLSGHPVRFSAGDVAFTPAPELGQHSKEILREFGFEESEIHRLIDELIVQTPTED